MVGIVFVAVLFVILLFPAIFVMANYNRFISLQNHIQNAWSNVDAELKRRYELIPNLVSTVKGYANHENEVLEKVTQLRNQCISNTGPITEQARDEGMLVAALQRLFVVVENYPNLKSDRNFLELQRELINTEDRIQAARRFFNGNVREYRTKLQSFPSNIVASIFGFKDQSYFQVEPSVRDVPNIDFEN